MTVGFYHAADQHTDHVLCALKLIKSVRQTMPGVEVVQFTTAESVRVPGVDKVRVFAARPVALGVLEAYSSCEGTWLFVDTDVLILEDVRHVLDRLFDVAVADRAGTLKEKEKPENGRAFMTRMPYNKGAVFSRSPAFWQAAVEECQTFKPDKQQWMGDQLAMNQVIAAGQFQVEVLRSRYNYAPHCQDEDLGGQAIVHFKGSRKRWLLERAA